MLHSATASAAPLLSNSRRTFTEEENATWAEVVRTQRPRRLEQLVPLFSQGLATLEMDRDTVPELDEVNTTLMALTGWRGEYVKGLEAAQSFFSLLRDRKFPIGNFVRDRQNLNYTPEPDIIHDLYGHIPFHADERYAEACQRYGEFACRFANDPERMRRLERFFWFTYEFGLVETKAGRRIFGAGIASSIGECVYALSGEPEVVPFDVETICAQEYRIDQMQRRLFVMPSVEALYESWPKVMAVVSR
jgi:phenylalanine-4-hydroxylase